MSTLTHGTVTAYGDGGCRCSACREASRQQRIERRELAAENGGVYPGDITHSASGYANYGCRCLTCTESHRSAVAAARLSRVERTRENGGVAPIAQHNSSTYRNWGCRCRDCTADSTEATRPR